MCGIIGVKTSNNNVGEILVDGLKKLEYRGYDSAGLAVIKEGTIQVKKDVGRIVAVNKKLKLTKVTGNIGLGHTRWSTCGKVTKENAHPHTSCDGKIAVVHNGIIENYRILKELLIKKGHKFTSQTDSEVIAHLIEEALKKEKNFKKAALIAIQQLKGMYAIVIIKNDTDEMIGVRRGSPLLVGMGKNEFFLSSDVNSFLSYTNKVVILDDNEMVSITDKVVIENIVENRKVDYQVQKFDVKGIKAELGKYQHFMLKEIYEQSTTLKHTFTKISKQLKKLRLKPFNRVVTVCCGTAYYATLTGSYFFERFLRLPVDVQYASEFRYRNPVVDEKTLVIAVSQSGETADTLEAVREAKKKGAFIVSICNVSHSTLVRESDFTLHTQAGTEIGVASTKAFTSQLLTLLLFAIHFAKHRQELSADEIKVYNKEINQLPSLVEKVLKKYDDLMKIAEKYSQYHNFLFLGRGFLYPIALEGALKLKEISYIHAEGQCAAELKHGPIALIDKDMPCVFLALKDKLYDKVLINMEEVRLRGGKIIAI
ncbi:MAG: glutamine--fructose-6-phosphate transaminase (isomerizing), partial [Candidatus Woesearchaeota archaeon]|nr:glutamine--fructose-6-phosphate transaminase (isomerizing) [Candidatus Woesearchaeota archaeon]